MNAVTLLPTNLYGPHDNFELETSHVIPAMIRKMTEVADGGDVVELWGDGSPTREFLYVDDCARAIVLALEHYGGEPVNIGTGEEITIKAFAEKVAFTVGFTGEIRWDPSKPNGQPRRCLDVSRGRDWFGFEAEVSLDEGLAEIVRSYPHGPRVWATRPRRKGSLNSSPGSGPIQ